MKVRTRKLLSAAAVAVLAAATSAKAEDTCKGEPGDGAAKLTVEATGLHSADGEVAVTVYPNDEYRFMAPGGKLARVRTPAARPATRACFWLPPGVYAVAIYHDEDGDHAFARDNLGRPAEGFGFSNDAPAAGGLPPLSAARFRLPPGGLTIRIRMRYLN
jgi:uncharacterized protein (DUF2141 family)